MKYIKEDDFNKKERVDGRGMPRKIDTVTQIIDRWLEIDKQIYPHQDILALKV